MRNWLPGKDETGAEVFFNIANAATIRRAGGMTVISFVGGGDTLGLQDTIEQVFQRLDLQERERLAQARAEKKERLAQARAEKKERLEQVTKKNKVRRR